MNNTFKRYLKNALRQYIFDYLAKTQSVKTKAKGLKGLLWKELTTQEEVAANQMHFQTIWSPFSYFVSDYSQVRNFQENIKLCILLKSGHPNKFTLGSVCIILRETAENLKLHLKLQRVKCYI